VPSKRHRAWVGFALFAALAIVGLFVLDGAVAGATLFVAMLVFIGACIYALRGKDPTPSRTIGDPALSGGSVGGSNGDQSLSA
jgi:hypothetical protein